MSQLQPFSVDVKAFMSVTVEARDSVHARQLADDFVRRLAPQHMSYVEGYNAGLENEEGRIVDETGFDVDGESDVDEAYL